MVEQPRRVGFVGLGLMGTPMARNLATAGLLEAVYNRTKERADDFALETGIASCASPAELAVRANVLITMVPDDDASLQTFAGADGFLEGIRPGTIALQMSTVSLGHVEQLAELLSAHGCSLLDVPVSGSVAMAEQGTLTLMAGGAASELEAVRPVLEAIGSRVFHLGPQGAGAAMKLAVNTVVYGLNEALAEGLVLAERAGIDRLQAYEVFTESAVAAPFVHYRRLAFERPDETPAAFRLALAAKDLALIKDFADALGQSLPQAELNAEVLAAAIEDGFADDDVSLVAEYLRRDGKRDLRAAEEPA